MAAEQEQQRPSDQKRRYDQLYQQYGKPLEEDHPGEFLAVSPEGKTLLGKDLLEIIERASVEFGPGNFIYRIGTKTVGKWR